MPAVYALQPLLHNGDLLEVGDEIPAEFVYHGKPRTTDLELLIAEGKAERRATPAEDEAALQVALDRVAVEREQLAAAADARDAAEPDPPPPPPAETPAADAGAPAPRSERKRAAGQRRQKDAT